MSNDEERFKPGDRIVADGHVYEVVRILGEGGMGVVYEVERSVGAILALKLLHLEHAREGGAVVAYVTLFCRFLYVVQLSEGPLSCTVPDSVHFFDVASRRVHRIQ